jgi:hypothetical protein
VKFLAGQLFFKCKKGRNEGKLDRRQCCNLHRDDLASLPHPFCIFNFWINLYYKSSVTLEYQLKHLSMLQHLFKFLVMCFSHFMLLFPKKFQEYMELWVGFGHGWSVTFMCDMVKKICLSLKNGSTCLNHALEFFWARCIYFKFAIDYIVL